MYIIRKSNTNSYIMYMEYDNPFYTLIVSNKDIVINNLHVYDKKYLPKHSDDKVPFVYLFNQLADRVFKLIYDDEAGDDDGNLVKMMSEVDKLLTLLNNEYKTLLDGKDYYDFMDKISFLKEELNNRLEINKYRRNLNSILHNRFR